MSSRDVKLAVLQHRYLAAQSMEQKLDAAQRVEEEMEYRKDVDLVLSPQPIYPLLFVCVCALCCLNIQSTRWTN